MAKKVKEGYGKILGHLEQDVMESLWKKGPISGKEVFAEVKLTRDLALTTVLTVLERLVAKGLVKKTRGESVYLFAPAFSKEEFAREVSQDVLKGIFDISRSGACASFVDMVAQSDPDELERLSDLIELKKKEMGKRD